MGEPALLDDLFAGALSSKGACCDSPITAMVEMWETLEAPHTKESIEEEIGQIEPTPYVRKIFGEPSPSLSQIQEELSREADQEVHTRLFWKTWKLKDEYVRARIRERYEKAVAALEERRANFEAVEDAAARKHDAEERKRCEDQRARLKDALAGDEAYLKKELRRRMGRRVVPLQYKLRMDLSNEDELRVRVLLPCVDEFPHTVVETTRSGKTKLKALSQRALREGYAEYLFALTAYVGRELFDLSPKVERVSISDYRALVDDFEHVECVFSVLFDRDGFVEAFAGDRPDPEEFCLGFEHRAAMTKTKVIKPVEPLEWGECA